MSKYLVLLVFNSRLSRSAVSRVPAGAYFCRADEFICNNTLCKLQTWVCDGKDDCGDSSDEDAGMCGRGPDRRPPGFPLKTYDKYFRCTLFFFFPFMLHQPLLGFTSLHFPHKLFFFSQTFSRAFPVFVTAAKHPCPPTRPFRCRNHRVCLHADQVCNRVDDCGDNSDEDECGEPSKPKTYRQFMIV